MTLKPSDLNFESKRQILDYFKNKLGLFEYQRLVNSIGEDGLIEIFFQQIEKENLTYYKPEENLISERKVRILKYIFLGIIIAILVTVVVFGSIYSENWFGKVLIGIGGIPILVLIFKYIDFSDFLGLSWLITGAIMVIIIFCCGIYQLITGAKQWWPSFIDKISDTLWPIITAVLIIVFIVGWIYRGIIKNVPRF
jgi:hypothetical protein